MKKGLVIGLVVVAAMVAVVGFDVFSIGAILASPKPGG